MFEALIESWEGEETVVHYDAPSGTWMFVCLHSSALGPASGGTRMKVYDTASDGLADAMDLSAAMTRKFAVAGLPMGGGKAVLAVRALPDPDVRRRVIERYADIVASLHERIYHRAAYCDRVLALARDSDTVYLERQRGRSTGIVSIGYERLHPLLEAYSFLSISPSADRPKACRHGASPRSAIVWSPGRGMQARGGGRHLPGRSRLLAGGADPPPRRAPAGTDRAAARAVRAAVTPVATAFVRTG